MLRPDHQTENDERESIAENHDNPHRECGVVAGDPRERHQRAAQDHIEKAQKRRRAPRILSATGQRERGRRRPHERERDDGQEKHRERVADRRTKYNAHKEEERHHERHHERYFEKGDLLDRPCHLRRKHAHQHETETDAAEDIAVRLRRDAIDILKKKDRSRDVGKERTEVETLQKTLAEEIAISHQHGKGGKALREAAHTLLLLQRFLEMHRQAHLHQPDPDKENEDPMPVRETQNLRPCDRRRDRSEAIHHHEERHELHQRRPFHHITRHRTGDHDAESAGEPLQKAESQEEMDLLRPRTAQRCEREAHHADKERYLAPQPIRDRPAQDLPDRHPHHRHRERRLRHRSGNMKIRSDLRQ